MTPKKELPDLDAMSYEEEAAFWDNADFSDYMTDEGIANTKVTVKRKSKPKDQLVAFRLETDDLNALRERADALGLGYSTLLRVLTKRFLRRDDSVLFSGDDS